MKSWRDVSIILLVAVFCTTCAAPTPIVVNERGTPYPILQVTQMEGNVKRVIDRQACVVLWVHNYNSGGGVAVLPVDQTALNVPECNRDRGNSHE